MWDLPKLRSKNEEEPVRLDALTIQAPKIWSQMAVAAKDPAWEFWLPPPATSGPRAVLSVT